MFSDDDASLPEDEAMASEEGAQYEKMLKSMEGLQDKNTNEYRKDLMCMEELFTNYPTWAFKKYEDGLNFPAQFKHAHIAMEIAAHLIAQSTTEARLLMELSYCFDLLRLYDLTLARNIEEQFKHFRFLPGEDNPLGFAIHIFKEAPSCVNACKTVGAFTKRFDHIITNRVFTKDNWLQQGRLCASAMFCAVTIVAQTIRPRKFPDLIKCELYHAMLQCVGKAFQANQDELQRNWLPINKWLLRQDEEENRNWNLKHDIRRMMYSSMKAQGNLTSRLRFEDIAREVFIHIICTCDSQEFKPVLSKIPELYEIPEFKSMLQTATKKGSLSWNFPADVKNTYGTYINYYGEHKAILQEELEKFMKRLISGPDNQESGTWFSVMTMVGFAKEISVPSHRLRSGETIIAYHALTDAFYWTVRSLTNRRKENWGEFNEALVKQMYAERQQYLQERR